MLSSLQLDEYYVDRLSVERGRVLSPTEAPPDSLEYDLRVGHEVGSKRVADGRLGFAVRLRISLESTNTEAPCPVRSVSADVGGVFSLPDDTPEELVGQLVPVNCLAILYGILRGQILQVTGTGAGGGFILPTLNILALVRRKQTDSGPDAVTHVTAKSAVGAERRIPRPKRQQRPGRARPDLKPTRRKQT